MFRLLPATVLASAVLMGTPVLAQNTIETDSEYLQNRAALLNDRIDIAVKDHKLTKKKAAKLHLTVGRVQTTAGNLQTRNGTISRADADRMNQSLTDVERALPVQR